MLLLQYPEKGLENQVLQLFVMQMKVVAEGNVLTSSVQDNVPEAYANPLLAVIRKPVYMTALGISLYFFKYFHVKTRNLYFKCTCKC